MKIKLYDQETLINMNLLYYCTCGCGVLVKTKEAQDLFCGLDKSMIPLLGTIIESEQDYSYKTFKDSIISGGRIWGKCLGEVVDE